MGLRARRAVVVVCAGLVLACVGVGGAEAATLKVCPSGCAFSQIAPAIAAAGQGDTIQVAPGTYDGGFTIDKSVTLAGARAGSTVIKGGGPVITIGQAFAASEPTVSISGVTITGGVTHSSFAEAFVGPGVIAVGGGISVPPAAGFAQGATVSIADSVITGNRVAPTNAIDSGLPCPPDITITCINGDLPFAQAAGGGINTFGAMTLTNATVSDNQVGGNGVASDVGPGGITSIKGGLTLENSTVTDNQAIASAPNGRFAETGGVADSGTTLTIDNSRISDNSAMLSTAMPTDIPGGTAAIAGGMHVGGGVQAATISNTTIAGNSARETNSLGDATAFSGGLHTDIDVTVSNDVIANNHVTSSAGSSGHADASAGGGEFSGSFTNIRLTGNTVDSSSAAGSASGEGGGTHFDGGTITNSLVSDNHVQVSGPGQVAARGGGIDAAVGATLRNTTVSGNTVDATGASGTVRGGGVFDAAFPDGPDGAPGGPLVLQNSRLTGNALTGSGLIVHGGGLYLENEPLTFLNSLIANNVPDQCFGC
jgi:hypothetical protein